MWGSHDWGGDSIIGWRSDRSQGWAWVGRKQSLLALTQVAQQKQPRSQTADTTPQLNPIHPGSLYGPCRPHSVTPQQARGGRGWGQWSAVRDKGNIHPRVCLSGANNCGYLDKHHIETAQTSVCGQNELRLGTGPTCFSNPHLWGKLPGIRRWENTLKENRGK